MERLSLPTSHLFLFLLFPALRLHYRTLLCSSTRHYFVDLKISIFVNHRSILQPLHVLLPNHTTYLPSRVREYGQNTLKTVKTVLTRTHIPCSEMFVPFLLLAEYPSIFVMEPIESGYASTVHAPNSSLLPDGLVGSLRFF